MSWAEDGSGVLAMKASIQRKLANRCIKTNFSVPYRIIDATDFKQAYLDPWELSRDVNCRILLRSKAIVSSLQ